MKIISRYILKEHVGPLLFALTALTSLLLLNYIARQFGQLVGKGLPWTVIAEFFLLSVPFTVAMTLPMAVLVSTLYAFSRLAAENEITAFKASGLSMLRLLYPVLFGAAAMAALMVAFNDQVLPRANHRLRTLQSDIARKKPTFALREQVINEVSPGKLFLKAGHIDEGSNRMREVVIYDLSEPQRSRTIYADSGNMGLTADQRDLQLTLWDGHMQAVPKAEPSQLQRIFFVQDHLRVRGVGNQLERSGETDTYKSDREMSICEMQREVDRYGREMEQARDDFAEALGNAAWEAATGLERAPTPPPERRASPSIGGLYCRVLRPLVGVKPAEAAESEDRTVDEGMLRATRPAPLPVIQQPAAQQPAAQQPAAQQPTPRQATPQRPAPQRPALKTPVRARGDSARAAWRLPVTRRDTLRPRARSAVLPPAIRSAPPRPMGAASDTIAALGGAPSYGQGRAQRRPTMHLPPAAIGGTLDAARARVLDSRRQMDALDVEIQKKFALGVACMVFVLLGAPIALRFPRGGVGLVISVSLGVFAIYYVGLIAGESLANRNLISPFWSMWGTNILFTLLGLILMARMGREASTTRGGDLSELWDTTRSYIARLAWRVGIKMDRRRRAA